MSILLEGYQKAIDESDFDAKNERKEVRALLQEYAEKMNTQSDAEGLRYLQLESDLHSITKSVTDGLSPVLQQTRQTEDGRTVEVLWPDYSAYGKDECDYFEKRYNQTQNIFFKTEYGLLLFLKQRLQHNNDRIALANNLIDLAKIYHKKMLANDSEPLYSYAFHKRLSDALSILIKAASLQTDFKAFIKLVEDWFLNWPVDNKSYVSFTYFITQVFAENKKRLQGIIDVDKILSKLENGINHFASSNTRVAISISEKAVLFSSAFKPHDKQKYIAQLASFYEAEGDLEIQNGRAVGAIKDYEDALSCFTQLKDTVSIERVSKKYEANKGKFEMGTVSVETDEDTSTKITTFINNIVAKKSPELIISCLCGYHIIGTAKSFKAQANKSVNSNDITNFCTLQSLDKFGNTLRVYTTKEDREFYHLANAINLSHQTSSQIMFQILWRSLKAGFFSFHDVKTALEKTWLNQPVEWMRHGKSHEVIPLDAILPGVENFFDELNRRIQDENYIPKMILCSDSLATKIEMILRYMSKNLNIPTFRYMEQGGVILTDEKTLGMLLEGLEGVIEEDDTILVRHLINEKGGMNIRNRVAHGLVDAKEYSPATPLTLLAIILRLSQYEFTKPGNTTT